MWLLLASCGGGPVRFDADFFAIVSPHRKAWRWRGRSTIVCRRGSRSTWRKPKGFSKMQPVDAASYVSWIRVRSSAFCWRVERLWSSLSWVDLRNGDDGDKLKMRGVPASCFCSWPSVWRPCGWEGCFYSVHACTYDVAFISLFVSFVWLLFWK